MQEIWKDIKDFEGLYQVSNLGQVRSLRYKNKKEINILNQFELNNKAKRKYLAVSLSKNNINYKKQYIDWWQKHLLKILKISHK